MSEPIEYIIACRCGRGLRLGLTRREQRDRDLNKNTRMFIDLFKYFHEQEGTVNEWFSDEPMRVIGQTGEGNQ